MTRINASIHPSELSDKHLIGEWHEIFRVSKLANKYSEKPVSKISSMFTLGKGHVCFFYDKFSYLHKRVLALAYELHNRGVTINNDLTSVYNAASATSETFWMWSGKYKENPRDRTIVLERLKERDPEFYKNHNFYYPKPIEV